LFNYKFSRRTLFWFALFPMPLWVCSTNNAEILRKRSSGWVALISAKNHKRQRRKRQSVTAKWEKSQTPKVLTAILTLPNLTWPNLTYTNFGVWDFSRLAVTDWRLSFLALSNAPLPPVGHKSHDPCFHKLYMETGSWLFWPTVLLGLQVKDDAALCKFSFILELPRKFVLLLSRRSVDFHLIHPLPFYSPHQRFKFV